MGSICSLLPTIDRMLNRRPQPLAMLSPVKYLTTDDVHPWLLRATTMQRPRSLNRLIEMDLLKWMALDSTTAHEDTWRALANGDRMVHRRVPVTDKIHMKCVKYVNRMLKLIEFTLEIMNIITNSGLCATWACVCVSVSVVSQCALFLVFDSVTSK